MEYPVKHNEEECRFEIVRDQFTACLTYVMRGGRMDITHVWVPQPMEGQGVGAALVKVALGYARKSGLGVIPTCPFARVYILRHPEYQPLMR